MIELCFLDYYFEEALLSSIPAFGNQKNSGEYYTVLFVNIVEFVFWNTDVVCFSRKLFLAIQNKTSSLQYLKKIAYLYPVDPLNIYITSNVSIRDCSKTDLPNHHLKNLHLFCDLLWTRSF